MENVWEVFGLLFVDLSFQSYLQSFLLISISQRCLWVILRAHCTLSVLILGLLVKIKHSINPSEEMLTIPLETLSCFSLI